MSKLIREDEDGMLPNLPVVSKTIASPAATSSTAPVAASSISTASGRRMSENTNKPLQQKSENKKQESTGISKSKVYLEKKKNESGHHSKLSVMVVVSSKKNSVITNNVSNSHEKNSKRSAAENQSRLPEISSKVDSVTDRHLDSRETEDVSSKHKISSKSHGSFLDFLKSPTVVHKDKPGIETTASSDSNGVAEIDNLTVRNESRMDKMATRNDTPVDLSRILTDRTFSNEKTASTKFIENKHLVPKDLTPSANSEKSSFMKFVESSRFVIKKLPTSLNSGDVSEYRSPIAENIPENHHHHQNAEKKQYRSDNKSSTRHGGKHGDDSAGRGSKDKSKHGGKVHRSESHPGKSRNKNDNERHLERQSSTKSVNKEEKDAVRKDSKSHDHRSKNDQENKSKRKNEQENQKSDIKLDGKQRVSEIGKDSSKTGHKSIHKEHSRSVHDKSDKSGSKDDMAKSLERQHSSKSLKTVYPDGRQDSSRTCLDGTRKIPQKCARVEEDIGSNNSADKLNENVKLPLQFKQTVDELNVRKDSDEIEKQNIKSSHVASFATSHNTKDNTSSPGVIEVSKTVTGEVTADDIRCNLNCNNNSCQSESITGRDVAVIRPVIGENPRRFDGFAKSVFDWGDKFEHC